MSKARHYSPRLDENLISPLYHAGLAALGGSDGGESCVVHEAPPAYDPRGRQD